MNDSAMSLQKTITLSLVLAASSLLSFLFLPLEVLLTTAWAGMVGYAFVKHGRRAWPTMLGALLAIPPLLLQCSFYVNGGP
jgi:hypothetical protein